jgi:hypothetical protein
MLEQKHNTTMNSYENISKPTFYLLLATYVMSFFLSPFFFVSRLDDLFSVALTFYLTNKRMKKSLENNAAKEK